MRGISIFFTYKTFTNILIPLLKLLNLAQDKNIFNNHAIFILIFHNLVDSSVQIHMDLQFVLDALNQ